MDNFHKSLLLCAYIQGEVYLSETRQTDKSLSLGRNVLFLGLDKDVSLACWSQNNTLLANSSPPKSFPSSVGKAGCPVRGGLEVQPGSIPVFVAAFLGKTLYPLCFVWMSEGFSGSQRGRLTHIGGHASVSSPRQLWLRTNNAIVKLIWVSWKALHKINELLLLKSVSESWERFATCLQDPVELKIKIIKYDWFHFASENLFVLCFY